MKKRWVPLSYWAHVMKKKATWACKVGWHYKSYKRDPLYNVIIDYTGKPMLPEYEVGCFRCDWSGGK